MTTENGSFFLKKTYMKKRSLHIRFFCKFVERYSLNETSWNVETFRTRVDYRNPINDSETNNPKTLFEIRKTIYVFFKKTYIRFFFMRQRGVIETLSKKFFEVGDPKNRRFWAFFQKSMSEISANSEKTCFLCCRFFWKIEKMGGYFGGCALIFFSKICTNVPRPVCKN